MPSKFLPKNTGWTPEGGVPKLEDIPQNRQMPVWAQIGRDLYRDLQDKEGIPDPGTYREFRGRLSRPTEHFWLKYAKNKSFSPWTRVYSGPEGQARDDMDKSTVISAAIEDLLGQNQHFPPHIRYEKIREELRRRKEQGELH
jgi:hypothetical protein